MSQLKAPVCNFESGNYTEESISGLTLTTDETIAPSWIAISNMNTARYSASSFSINGKGYVCGGYGNERIKSVECYDPSTNTWSTVTPMTTARNRTSSFSIDGKGYVCGGDDDNGYTKSVEYYNPSTNTWSTVTPMATARNRTSSFSINGKGYVCGGYDDNGYTNSVECYNPSTNTWSTVTPMTTARIGASSFSVDGKGYMCGGHYSGYIGVECYDPTINTWSTAANMNNTRSGASSFVLDGKGYVCGGYDLNTVECYNLASGTMIIRYTVDGTTVTTTSPIYSNSLSITTPGKINAKCYASGYTESLELSKTFNRKLPTPTFNYSSGDYLKNTVSDVEISTVATVSSTTVTQVWSAKANLLVGKYFGAGFSIGTKGYICGGYKGYSAGGISNSTECYDSLTNTWTTVANMNMARQENPAGFAIGNYGYIAGGCGTSAYTNTVEKYDPSSNTWVYVTNMNASKGDIQGCFVIGTKAYVVGGYVPGSGYTTAVECYDPSSNTWVYVASTAIKHRVCAQSFSIGNYGYIGAGTDGTTLSDTKVVERYDPTLNIWTTVASTNNSRNAGCGFSLNGKGYFVSGFAENMYNYEEYDPTLNKWTSKTGTYEMMLNMQVFVIGSTAYICGGLDLDTYGGSNLVRAYTYGSVSVQVPAGIKYTIGGSTPTGSSSTYSSPLNPGLPSVVKAVSYSSETGYVASDVATLTLNRKFDPPTFDLYNATYKNNKLSNFVINSTEDISNLKIVSTTGYTVESSETNKKIISIKMPADVEVSNYTVAAGYATSEVNKIKLTEIDKPTTNYTSGIKGVDSISDLTLTIPQNVYGEGTNKWINIAHMNDIRSHGFVTFVINGKGYACGGSFTNTAECYDPSTNTWSYIASMNGKHGRSAGFAIDNYGYVCGGYDGDPKYAGHANAVECYDPATNTWSYVQSMNMGRDFHVAESIGKFGYVASGNTAEKYDPATNTWIYISNLPLSSVANGGSFAIGDDLYICGGSSYNVSYSSKVLKLNTLTNTWTTVASISVGKKYVCGYSTAGYGYIIGGSMGGVGGGSTSLVERYNPTTNTWDNYASMNLYNGAASYLKAFILNDKIHICGGYAGYVMVRDAYLYDIKLPTEYRDILYSDNGNSFKKYSSTISAELPANISASCRVLYTNSSGVAVFGISEPLQLILGDKKIHLEPAECNTTTIENKTRLVKGVVLTDKNNEPVDLAYYKIYYTLDGSEPAENEMISETAIEYTAPIDLYLPTRLKYCIVPIYKGDE